MARILPAPMNQNFSQKGIPRESEFNAFGISHFYPVFKFIDGDDKFFLDFLNYNRTTLGMHCVGSSQKVLSLNALRDIKFILPPVKERCRISEILSTWDRAIAVQEQLVANARAQKKALMQTLLTGKKRLPGFKGECKWIAVSEILTIETGGSNREDSLDVGPYTFFDRSTDVRRSDQYLFDTEAIVIGGEGQDFILRAVPG